MLRRRQELAVLRGIGVRRTHRPLLQKLRHRNDESHEENQENDEPLIVDQRRHDAHQRRPADNVPNHEDLNKIDALLHNTARHLHCIDEKEPPVKERRRSFIDEIPAQKSQQKPRAVPQ